LGSVRKWHDYSLFIFPATRSSRHPSYTAPIGTTTPQGTMFPSGATGSAVGCDNVLHHPLMFLIKTLLVSMIYMMFPLLVNIIHMMLLFIWNKQYIDVIMIMLMMFLFFLNKHLITTVMIMIMSFCWIKLELKLPIFLTI
jgi:hypothetical protein